MKLTVKLKLLPRETEKAILRETIELVNAACNRLSELAFGKNEVRQFPMQRLFYQQIRTEFPALASQAVIRLISKVSDAYKLDEKTQRTFRSLGSITYDARILDFQLAKSTVSIWAIGGRIKCLPFVCGEQQRKLLELPKGESDMILHKGKWYLHVTVEVPEAQEYEALEWMGIDLGLSNIAQSSDGRTFGDANKVAGIRDRRWRQRKRLQKKSTRSSRRVLRRLKKRESRFVQLENHVISKQICAEAERTKRGVALEDLKGIRSRIRARKSHRRILHSWAFHDLQSKITYKCRLAGVPVKFVDPRNTSRTCPACGSVAKANRKSRDLFACVSCGFTADADTSAASNIAGRAAVNRPNERDGARAHVQMPRSLLRG